VLFWGQNRLFGAPDNENEIPLNKMYLSWQGLRNKWKRDIIGKIKKNAKRIREQNIAQLILNFDTVWRCIVNFTFRPFYPQERTKPSKEWDIAWAPAPVSTFQEKRDNSVSLTGFQCVLINIGESSEINYWPTETALIIDGFLFTALIQILSSSRKFKTKTTLLTDLWFAQNASIYKGRTAI
jgi:hypothetical protein